MWSCSKAQALTCPRLTLGGTLNLPHAETHAVLLPHVIAYNHAAAPEAMQRVARALNARDPAFAVHELALQLGAPTRLADIGMQLSDLERVAKIVAESPYANPRPVDFESILSLLEDA